VEKRLPLHQMILFGSRARGDADEGSDMDVLVVLESLAGPEEQRHVSQCAWKAGFEYGIVVSSIAVSRSEWEEGPLSSSLLALAVEKEGVAV
jgi:predicted nucleotidyltransferase